MELTQKIRQKFLKKISILLIFFIVGLFFGQFPNFSILTSLQLSRVLILPITIGVLSFLFAKWIKRAYTYQIFICLLSEISLIAILFSIYVFLNISTLNIHQLINIVGLLISFIFLSVVSIQIERYFFSTALKFNIQSGKIDLNNATWNLSKLTVWVAPHVNKKRRNIIWFFLLLIFVLGIYFILEYDVSWQLFSKLSLLYYCYWLAILSGRNINLLFQFGRWESEIGKPIMIKKA